MLRGHLRIGDVDVSKQSRAFRFRSTSDIAERPPTATNPNWRPTRGGIRWWVDFTILSSPVAGSLTRTLYDAYRGDGQLSIAGAVTRDEITDDNPMFTATMLVSDWAIGGDVATRMMESFSFRLVEPPEPITW